MGQEIQRLSALAVTRASKPGLYADGAGLYLRVSRNGSKSWAFRFTLRGKPREMGLGGLTKVALADARKKAADARLLLSDGRDPLDLRQEEEAKRVREEKLAAARGMTFDKCAEAYMAAHELSWRNVSSKHFRGRSRRHFSTGRHCSSYGAIFRSGPRLTIRHSPNTRRRCSSRISSAMLILDSCTSSTKGAFGWHERQDSDGKSPSLTGPSLPRHPPQISSVGG